MEKDTNTYTIRQLLIDSLPSETPDVIERMAKVRPIEGEEYNNVLIRSNAFDHHIPRDALRNTLLSSTHLYAPERLLTGPKVSQVLLSLCPADKMRLNEMVNDAVEPDPFLHSLTNAFTARPALDIVPNHEGTDLETFLGIRKGDPSTHETNWLKLTAHLLDNPDVLRALYKEAAFIGLQNESLNTSDIHAENIMVDDQLNLSNIDIVPSENVRVKKAGLPAKRKAEGYLSNGAHTTLHTDLLRCLVNCDAAKLHQGRAEEMHQLMDVIKAETIEDIYSETLTATKQGWEGFVEGADIAESIAQKVNEKTGHTVFDNVDGVQAVRLDAPAYTLKVALDELYAKAIPAQGASR